MSDAFTGTASSQASAGSHGRQIAPLASLIRHPAIALAVAVSLMMLGLAASIVMGKPRYMAEAAIRIAPVFGKTLSEDVELRFNSNSDYREFVQQQVVDIDSYETAQLALDRLGQKRWLWQRHGETNRRAAERLMAALAVHSVPDTYLVTIGLEDSNRNGLADILNAVASAYLVRQQSQELYGSDRRIALLDTRRKDLESLTARNFKLQAEIGQSLGVSTFEEKFINPYDKELVDANEALGTARRERINAEAKLAAMRSHIKRVLDLQIDSQAQEILSSDRALGDLRTELYRRKAAVFLQLRDLAPGHPGRRALMAEHDDIERELTSITQQALDRIRTMLLESRANKAAEELSQAEATVDETRRTEQGLSTQLDALRSQVTEFTNRYNQAIDLRGQDDRARKEIDEVDDRISFLTMESKAPGFVRLASAARSPEIPVKGGRTKIFVMFAFVGLALGAAVPAVVDYFDPRVLSAGELSLILGFPPLGVTLDDSLHRTARGRDLMRHIALGVAREWRASGNRLFVLTGCHPGSGVTTLVLDLANQISALGVRAIAVEANIDHLDSRYGSSPIAPGLVEALSGAASLESAITDAAGEVPARMGLGNIVDFHHVWKVDALRDLFARLYENYDVVLLDSPPILDSAETELLVSMPAAVILVAMAREFSQVVRRAALLLAKLSPPVVGTIFSRVNSDPGKSPGESVAGLPLETLSRWFWHDPQ